MKISVSTFPPVSALFPVSGNTQVVGFQKVTTENRFVSAKNKRERGRKRINKKSISLSLVCILFIYFWKQELLLLWKPLPERANGVSQRWKQGGNNRKQRKHTFIKTLANNQ